MNIFVSNVTPGESNQAHPTTERLLMLFEIYEVDDVLDALDGKPQKKRPTIEITKEEAEFIEAYRANPEKQEAVRRIIFANEAD